MFNKTYLILLMVFAVSCGSPTVSDTKFTQGAVRGHEILLAWAIEKANEDIADSFGGFEFEEISKMEFGTSSSFSIVLGGYATDFPSRVIEHSLHEFYGVDETVDMPDEGEFQNQHFLRNYKETMRVVDDEEVAEVEWVASAKEACEASKEVVVAATVEAVNMWDVDRSRSQFFLGHALHAVQDSFATVHAKRSEDFKTIEDICIYNRRVEGVCHHHFLSLKDKVFKASFRCLLNKEDWDCLVPEAVKAIEASSGYLYTVAKHLKDDTSSIESEMQKYFETADYSPEGSGYFRCDHL